MEKAKHRLDEAVAKLKRTRHWARVLERESLLYQGQMQGLAARLERDVPKALARLDKLLGHLKAYVSTAPPSEGEPAAGRTDLDNAAGAGPDAAAEVNEQ